MLSFSLRFICFSTSAGRSFKIPVVTSLKYVKIPVKSIFTIQNALELHPFRRVGNSNLSCGRETDCRSEMIGISGGCRFFFPLLPRANFTTIPTPDYDCVILMKQCFSPGAVKKLLNAKLFPPQPFVNKILMCRVETWSSHFFFTGLLTFLICCRFESRMRGSLKRGCFYIGKKLSIEGQSEHSGIIDVVLTIEVYFFSCYFQFFVKFEAQRRAQAQRSTAAQGTQQTKQPE